MCCYSHMTYACHRCPREFDRQVELHRHLARKTPCTADDIIPTKSIQCPGCPKNFSHRSSLSRHRQVCTGSDLAVQELQAQLQNVQQQLSRLGGSVSNTTTIIDNSVSSTVNNSNNTTNNITNINIQVNSLGYESTDELVTMSFRDLTKLLKLTPDHDSLVNMIKYVHLNRQHPENHNVQLESLESQDMQVFRNGRWKTETVESAIYDLISRNCLRFLDISEVLERGMQKAKREALTEYLELAEDMANKEDAQLHSQHFFPDLVARTKAVLMSDQWQSAGHPRNRVNMS